MMHRYSAVLLGVILCGSAILLGINIDKPFVGHHDFNSAWESTGARNHLRYGLLATKGITTRDDGPVAPGELHFYYHHPPLVPLIAAGVFAILGVHEWSARLIAILFTLGSVILVFLLGRRRHSPAGGLLAAAIFALLPMTAYFGRMLNHEPLVQFFALLCLFGYSRWCESRNTGDFTLMLAAFAGGCLSGWPAYYLAAILPAHFAIRHRRDRDLWRILSLPAAAALVFGLLMFQVWLMGGLPAFADLAWTIAYRTGNGTAQFSWSTLPGILWHRAVPLFTWPALALAVAYLFLRSRTKETGAIPILLVFGLCNVLLLPQAAQDHDYWICYFSAPFAIAAAGTLLALAKVPWAGKPVLAGVLGLFAYIAIAETFVVHTWDEWVVYEMGMTLRGHTAPDEFLAKTAGTPEWDVLRPQTFFYADRRGFGIPVLHTVDEIERLRTSRPDRKYAILVFPWAADAHDLEVEADPAFAAAIHQKFAGYRFEELWADNYRFELLHLTAGPPPSEH